MKITLGADPEFFLQKTSGKIPEYVSAHNLVPGSKKKPFPLKNGAVQVDGTAVEFNIDPAHTPEEFAGNIESVLTQIREMIPKEYKFIFSPSVEYPLNVFRKLPQRCLELGCDPDYNAYTAKENVPPKPIGTMRTGAGHIHIGWGNGLDVKDRSHMWDCCEVTKHLDNVLWAISEHWDKDYLRSKMYGRKGSFRPKSYGVEYRVLSNAWLNYPDLWPILFTLTQKIMNKLEEQGDTRALLWAKGTDYIFQELKRHYQIDLPQELKRGEAFS